MRVGKGTIKGSTSTSYMDIETCDMLLKYQIGFISR